MKIDNKFQIGEILKAKIDDTGNTKYHVVEIKTLTCPAGTQIYYHCRIHVNQDDKRWAVTDKLWKLNEIELEKWPENS
jgi:hypothetical protein